MKKLIYTILLYFILNSFPNNLNIYLDLSKNNQFISQIYFNFNIKENVKLIINYEYY
jgi:hypothetical protein